MPLCVPVALALALLASPPSAEESRASLALKRILLLTGEWEGSFEWTGARSDHGTMHASYSPTGNGSAAVENLGDKEGPAMTTLYHLDGPDLRMTHFCAARNQPRLKADRIDLEQGILSFGLVDITNLATPEAPHVEGFEMHLLGADHIELSFRFTAGGKASRELIDLKRVARSTAATP